MNFWIAGAGAVSDKESDRLERLRTRSEFRKATLGMTMAYASIEQALAQAGRREMKGLGLVVGTSHGEFGATRDFLKTLADTGVPRPLLFQNSLHNATLGFLAMTLGLTGPGVTVSNHAATSENALETAELLLADGACLGCLVIGVDVAVPQSSAGGAGALLIAGDEGLAALGLRPLAQLKPHRPKPPHRRYDASSIEDIARELISR